MYISWFGLSCFEIGASTSSGEARLVSDPYDGDTGLKAPRALEAEIVTISRNEKDANSVAVVGGSPFIIRIPGEYEVREIFVFGIPAPLATTRKGSANHVIYRFEMEQMRIAHLGAIDRPLTNQELESLENIDILILPVGGGRVLNPQQAVEVIEQVEPRVVIPMFYGLPGLKEELGDVESFCSALGTCRRETTSKFKITKKDLPEDDMLIMVLSKS